MAVEAGLVIHANPHNPWDCHSCLLFVCAAAVGDLAYTKYLLEAGGDVHADDDRALVETCAAGHVDVVKYLISKGAHVDVWEEEPLNRAGEKGHKDVIRVFLENGADPIAHPSVFRRAVRGGFLDVVHMMIETGVDARRTIDGTLPCAAYAGHIDIVRFLLNFIGTNALEYLRKAVKFAYEWGYNDIATLIFEKYHREGTLADLVEAVTWSHVPNLTLLLRNGVTDDGQALKIAIRRGHLPVVKILLYLAFEPHSWQNYDDNIRCACVGGHADVVDEILCYLRKDYFIGFALQKHPVTTLEYTVRNGHTKVIAVLLRHGLDPTTKTGHCCILPPKWVTQKSLSCLSNMAR
ncbi:hypothetical protein HK097_010195 [Rhizophlyctis rosea]|uniref:Uncharacterized protein n=1 Tax=Rhizophlyctis rosea TaxID=64517 RepID=A0AAD5S9G4_9FUNG|nr:hypothetical protein HK097_010195 [Rhizophlyctis rosea]